MAHKLEPNTERPRWKFLAVILAYTVVLKILPYMLHQWGMDVEKNFAIYPWNFSPIFALCLFGGAMYQSKLNALWIPLSAMLLGDLGIWAVTGKLEWAFYPGQFVVYVAFAMCAAIGFVLKGNKSWTRVVSTGIFSCVSFYLLTNFAMWVGSTNYPQTLDGLLLCYAAGLPFLKNSLVATAIFGGLLFSPVAVQQVSAAPSRSERLPVPQAS